jgi:hypothetical protein
LGMSWDEQAEGFVFNPDRVTYAVRVDGMLDLDRLAWAWEVIQRRYPVLGSSFDIGRDHWRTEEPATSALTLSHLPLAGSAEAALDELGNVLQRPFDLTRGPLARLHVVPIDDCVSLVGFGAEHLVCDAWSVMVLGAELWRLYQEPDDELPPVRVTFPELVAEEYAWLASTDGVSLMESRVKMLSEVGPLPGVLLPGARAGSANQGAPHRATFTVSRADVARLRSVDATRVLAPSALAHAALAAAIHELTGNDLVGTLLAVANRADRRLHQTQGWLSDNVVVLSRARGDIRKPGFLGEFVTAVATALDYSILPLAAVMARMEPDLIGRAGPYPLAGFNSLASPSSLRRHIPPPTLRDLELSVVPAPGSLQYKAIVVKAVESVAGLDVGVSVKDRWFQPDTAELLSAQMQDVLVAWAEAAG